jgi:hypothetical protein
MVAALVEEAHCSRRVHKRESGKGRKAIKTSSEESSGKVRKPNLAAGTGANGMRAVEKYGA